MAATDEYAWSPGGTVTVRAVTGHPFEHIPVRTGNTVMALPVQREFAPARPESRRRSSTPSQLGITVLDVGHEGYPTHRHMPAVRDDAPPSTPVMLRRRPASQRSTYATTQPVKRQETPTVAFPSPMPAEERTLWVVARMDLAGLRLSRAFPTRDEAEAEAERLRRAGGWQTTCLPVPYDDR